MSFSTPKVGIVVLNYNGQSCLLQCLESLLRLHYENFFLVIVDNASEDGSLLLAKQRFPEQHFIAHSENSGFAKGMNIGIEAALTRGAQYVWLFNNDATTSKDTLTSLIAVAQGCPRAGLLSPYIFETEGGKLWFGKGIISFFRMRTTHVLPSPAEWAQKWHESEFLTGCALLIKKEVLATVGALDERFFLYYEDADLSIRARKGGFLSLAVPGAHVFHSEQSQENPKKLYYLVLSGLLFFEKHSYSWRRPYFLLYGTMRKLKNTIDVAFGKKNALIVRQAFDSFCHDR